MNGSDDCWSTLEMYKVVTVSHCCSRIYRNEETNDETGSKNEVNIAIEER